MLGRDPLRQYCIEGGCCCRRTPAQDELLQPEILPAAAARAAGSRTRRRRGGGRGGRPPTPPTGRVRIQKILAGLPGLSFSDRGGMGQASHQLENIL
jgi:hypothetical protein